MTEPSTGRTPLAERVYALIYNGITKATLGGGRHGAWIRLSERERFAQAVYAELCIGDIEFRLGPLALLAQAAETEARVAAESAGEALPADEHHYDTSCDDRPYCKIPQHHALEDMP